MDTKIDCIGLFCPIPVIKAKIAFKNLDKYESITIITDHSCTQQGILEVFKNFNCRIEVEDDAGIWYIKITKL
ncbi:MAG: transcriptional regulator [Caloramator sp.]|nr:MAG: transcriptional regulator [Caloramator sp.]